ncbi:Glutathione S-transferase [Rhynchospora pubera]|uniref:glutathione transferase n=1 Tax=Rhynchospora pubera TaxID=906938 RepID=A0AAV8FZX2_9POAL|nr:Glutathione S-transferase [Rhynchospora pubera]KAJ4796437.1 Glutathione S-transferase [Rhynchospora pubera]
MAGSQNPEVKLLGAWASPYVARARIALHLKEVQYEFLEEKFGAKSELLLKSNPVHKKIPVLIHDEKPVCESMIIVQYIDDVWVNSGPALMPTDLYERALQKFWTIYIDDKFIPSLFGMMTSPTEEAKAEAKEQTMTSLQLLEEAFGKISKGKPFFGGDTIGYLDIALGSFLGWMKAFEEMNSPKLLDKTKTPLLCAWAENFCNNEAAAAVLPETAKLVEFATVTQTRFKYAPPAK